MELLSKLGIGARARWRDALHRAFRSEFRGKFAPSAVELLTEEAIAYVFRSGRGPRYGEAEFLIAQLGVFYVKLESRGARKLQSGAISAAEIQRLRELGLIEKDARSTPWGG